jgi:cell wall-associated NlpC family hydrolase
MGALCAIALSGVVATAAPLPTAVPGSASPAEFVAGSNGRAAKMPGPWSWSAPSIAWTSTSKLFAPALVAKGATTKLNRAQFLSAVAKLEAIRATRSGTPRLLAEAGPGVAYPDAAPTSLGSRAIKLGWLTPVGGRFAPYAPITANEAALLMTGVLGLRGSTGEFAVRLKTTFPELQIPFTYAAAQALVRTVGLRYNVLDPWDALELGPTETVNLAHGSYMLATAGKGLGSWKLDEARQLASTFELPALGANQRRVLGTAISQLGQPYIWAGETEGRQSEGHGGFDCSGFTIRVINSSGVPAADLASINERTTYTQSAIPATQRIARPNLQPGDALYFGSKGPRSAPGENYHAGVYMGNGWFIHSSGGNGGVAINSLDGWWSSQFAWGRRALRRG